jgi:hypothetical protein
MMPASVRRRAVKSGRSVWVAFTPRTGATITLNGSVVNPDGNTSDDLVRIASESASCSSKIEDGKSETIGPVRVTQGHALCDTGATLFVKLFQVPNEFALLLAILPKPSLDDETRRFFDSVRFAQPVTPFAVEWTHLKVPGDAFTVDIPTRPEESRTGNQDGGTTYTAETKLAELRSIFFVGDYPWQPDPGEKPEGWMDAYEAGLATPHECGAKTYRQLRRDISPEHLVSVFEVICPRSGMVMAGDIHFVAGHFHVLLLTLGKNEQGLQEEQLHRFFSSYAAR